MSRLVYLPIAAVLVGLCTDPLSGQESSSPVKFVSVTAGASHSCALTAEHIAYCWGANREGMLGTAASEECKATDSACTRPVPVAGDHRFIALAAGLYQTCGLTTDSLAYCWGSNLIGGLGVPKVGEKCFGVPSTAISGGAATCALTADGVAYCWGGGPLGVKKAPEKCDYEGDKLPCTRRPIRIIDSLTFTTITAGSNSACAITHAGVTYCWGLIVSTTKVTTPTAVRGNPILSSVSADHDKACGMTPDGRVTCWGWWHQPPRGWGQVELPTQVGDSGFTLVSVAILHACGLRQDGAAYCWGSDNHGQLGLGPPAGGKPPMKDHTPLVRVTWDPRRVSGDLAFTMLSAGGEHTCGVTGDGDIYCWGLNRYGQLGDGTVQNRDQPTRVLAPTMPVSLLRKQ